MLNDASHSNWSNKAFCHYVRMYNYFDTFAPFCYRFAPFCLRHPVLIPADNTYHITSEYRLPY